MADPLVDALLWLINLLYQLAVCLLAAKPKQLATSWTNKQTAKQNAKPAENHHPTLFCTLFNFCFFPQLAATWLTAFLGSIPKQRLKSRVCLYWLFQMMKKTTLDASMSSQQTFQIFFSSWAWQTNIHPLRSAVQTPPTPRPCASSFSKVTQRKNKVRKASEQLAGSSLCARIPASCLRKQAEPLS